MLLPCAVLYRAGDVELQMTTLFLKMTGKKMVHSGEWLRELFNNEIKFKSIFRGNSNLVKNFERGLSKLIGFDQNDLCLTYSILKILYLIPPTHNQSL